MSSVGIAVNSQDYWKGTDCIERKLGSVLDRKVASCTKQVLIDRIEFKEASKPDPFYQQLKKKYTPLNGPSLNQETSNYQGQFANNKKNFEANCKVSKNELPAPKYVLFEKDKVQLQWQTVRRVGPGLFNLGNTCFLNSVIQVLTYTPPLVNYLATQEHSRNCNTVGFCMLCELQRHVLRTFLHSQNEAIKPLAILKKLKDIAKHLRFGQQEDSHEFLRYVIDGMMKSCLVGISEKLDAYTKATTMVHQVFGGYYRSQVTCEKCHHTSNTYDPLMEVLLDIKHAYSVVNALHKLISVELLNKDNMYLCPRCKRKVPAKKNLRVHQAPNVMTMCLKRFDSHSLFATKINKEISYPEQLNLRPFMSKDQGPAVNYKLYAVLVHSGYSCNSGHYYCFIKAANNQWYQMNDSSVREVSLKTVLAQQAYLLFYIKELNTQKEKTGATQQPFRNTMTNGTKTERFNQKQHLPKVISEPTKKPQQFPKRPEPSWKHSAETHKHSTPRPTTIPQQRQKITFALNHGTQPNRPNTSQTDGHKESQTKAVETDARTSMNSKEDSLASAEQREELQVNEVSSSVESKEKEGLSAVDKKNHQNESNVKDVAKEAETNEGLHATTKWTVTKNGTGVLPTGLLPGPLPSGDRERTPSMSSEQSNPGSVACKTGEWSVSERSKTQDMCPRLPERQHAGWTVSSAESTKESAPDDIEKRDFISSEQKPEQTDEVESHKKSKKKRKHSKEKYEGKKSVKLAKSDDKTNLLSADCREQSEDDDERRGEKMKRLRKLEKAKKRESGEGSSGEDETRDKRKKHKKAKKKKRGKKKYERLSDDESNSKNVGQGSGKTVYVTHEAGADNTCETDLRPSNNERKSDLSDEKKRGKTKYNKIEKEHSENKDFDRIRSKKIRPESLSDLGNEDDSFGGKISKTKERNSESSKDRENYRNFGDKCNKRSKKDEYIAGEDELYAKKADGVNVNAKGKDFIGKVPESRNKEKVERKPLVQYSDHSSSSEQESSTGISRIHEDTSRSNRGEKETEKRVKSRSSEEIPRESDRRRNIVDKLMENSRKSSNYGRLVERWDGERSDEPSKETEESHKRRRDYWDEEYDRGKVKRTNSKHKSHSHSYNRENSFQREYDKKRMRSNGWHSTSSSGWHKRHSDRHSRRDRR